MYAQSSIQFFFFQVMTGMKEIKVGLIGFGTVGKGLAEVLLAQRERLIKRTGMVFRLAGIADTSATELPERFGPIPLTKMPAI
jgi:homoserine dehydrogenase